MRIAIIYLICIIMALCAWYCHRQDLAALRGSVQSYHQSHLPEDL